MSPDDHISVDGDVAGSILITGSHNVVQRAQAAQLVRTAGRSPIAMLCIAARLAAPVADPLSPHRAPTPLDLHTGWQRLTRAVHDAHAPILLTRLTSRRLRRHHSGRAAAIVPPAPIAGGQAPP